MSLSGTRSSRSTTDVFTDVIDRLSTLFLKETALARAEVSEKISQAVGGLAMIVVGAVLLIPALVILLQAAVAALESAGIAEEYATLIVGGAAFLIGLVLLLVGVSRLKAKNLAPKRTLEQLQSDASIVKEQVK
jgi:hypothetical protein